MFHLEIETIIANEILGKTKLFTIIKITATQNNNNKCTRLVLKIQTFKIYLAHRLNLFYNITDFADF